jgi:hypothetical protein
MKITFTVVIEMDDGSAIEVVAPSCVGLQPLPQPEDQDDQPDERPQVMGFRKVQP